VIKDYLDVSGLGNVLSIVLIAPKQARSCALASRPYKGEQLLREFFGVAVPVGVDWPRRKLDAVRAEFGNERFDGRRGGHVRA
jgi:hypothetical protein